MWQASWNMTKKKQKNNKIQQGLVTDLYFSACQLIYQNVAHQSYTDDVVLYTRDKKQADQKLTLAMLSCMCLKYLGPFADFSFSSVI